MRRLEAGNVCGAVKAVGGTPVCPDCIRAAGGARQVPCEAVCTRRGFAGEPVAIARTLASLAEPRG
jgi:hypothetical protein